MVDRRDLGSWLQGSQGPQGPQQPQADGLATGGHPGESLGLVAQGTGSVARVGRRLVGVIVDWLACLLVSSAFLQGDAWGTLSVFAVVQVLTVGTAGASPGQALLGMRVQREDGGWAGPGRALVRTVLLCLVLPAVVFDRDQRGLHDRVAGTVLVRR